MVPAARNTVPPNTGPFALVLLATQRETRSGLWRLSNVFERQRETRR